MCVYTCIYVCIFFFIKIYIFIDIRTLYANDVDVLTDDRRSARLKPGCSRNFRRFLPIAGLVNCHGFIGLVIKVEYRLAWLRE